MVRKILLATTVLVAPFGATAADLPPVKARSPNPVADWSGFYIGVNAGGGLFRTTLLDTDGGAFNESGGVPNSMAGFTVGGGAGYNWQAGSAVFGVEADWSWANASKTLPLDDTNSWMESKWEHVATVRGRIGFTIDNLLIYGTGGVAFAGVKGSARNDDPLDCSDSNTVCSSDVKVGFVVGGGLEAMLSDRWSVKGEYLYVDLDTVAFRRPNDDGIVLNHQAHIARLGLNYRFAGNRAAPASASAPADWSGLTIGVNAGSGAFGTTMIDVEGANFAEGGNVKNRPVGYHVGLGVGYNWQVRSTVFGVEADWSYVGASKTLPLADDDEWMESEWQHFGTVRGRLGVAFGNVLVYGTGGVAFAGVKGNARNEDLLDCDPNGVVVCYSTVKVGLVAGAGLEAMLSDHWSLKGEYLYADFDSIGLRDEGNDDGLVFNHDAHIVRVGLNYRFVAPSRIVARY